MSLEAMVPIKYQRDGEKFKIEEGTILPKTFFTTKERNALLDKGRIRRSKERPEKLKGMEVPEFQDLGKMTVVEAKEFLDEEYEIVNLEKFIDQENHQKTPRSSIIKFIERRIRDLVGPDA